MEQTFMTELYIKKVRHLHDIHIPLSKNERKHLILTGKNGSGKTSVLDELAKTLDDAVNNNPNQYTEDQKNLAYYKEKLKSLDLGTEENRRNAITYQEFIDMYTERLKDYPNQVQPVWNSLATMITKYKKGEFILAYYKAYRVFEAEEEKML